MREFSHPGNDRAYVLIAEYEPQRELGHRDVRGMLSVPLLQRLFHRISSLNTRNQVLGNEVSVAPVALRPLAIFGQSPRECALIKWHARNHGNVHLTAGGKQLVFRILVEDVVD